MACDAFGFCAELLPERVTVDEWGYPLIDGRPIDPALMDVARQAVGACPRRALVLEPAVTDHLHTAPTGGSPPPVK